MKITAIQHNFFTGVYWEELRDRFSSYRSSGAAPGVFRTMVLKEVGDHIRSWRVVILMGLILLTCIGSLYTSLTAMSDAGSSGNSDDAFFFLHLFTLSDGSLPPFSFSSAFWDHSWASASASMLSTRSRTGVH